MEMETAVCVEPYYAVIWLYCWREERLVSLTG